jgi:hypothetical protein
MSDLHACPRVLTHTAASHAAMHKYCHHCYCYEPPLLLPELILLLPAVPCSLNPSSFRSWRAIRFLHKQQTTIPTIVKCLARDWAAATYGKQVSAQQQKKNMQSHSTPGFNCL